MAAGPFGEGFGVQLAVRDQFSAPLSKFAASIARSKSATMAFTAGLKSSAMRMGIFAIGVAGVGYAFSKAMKPGIEFQRQMREVSAVTGAAGKEFIKMTNLAKKLGIETVFSAREASGAMYMLGSRGIKTAQQMEMLLKPSMDLAAALKFDLPRATELTMSTLKMFGMKLHQSREVVDLLTNAYKNSAANAEKLALSMQYVGPAFSSVNYELKQALPPLEMLYDLGIKASMAGTALRKAINSLIKPTSEGAAALRAMGLSVEQVSPELHSFVDIIDTLGEAGLTNADAITIFGQRAGPVMAKLVAEGGDALREYEKQLMATGEGSDKARKLLATYTAEVEASGTLSAFATTLLQSYKLVVEESGYGSEMAKTLLQDFKTEVEATGTASDAAEQLLRGYEDALLDSGSAAMTAAEQLKGLPGALVLIKSSIESVWIALEELFAPALEESVKWVTEGINSFLLWLQASEKMKWGIQDFIKAYSSMVRDWLKPSIVYIRDIVTSVMAAVGTWNKFSESQKAFVIAGAKTGLVLTGLVSAIAILGPVVMGLVKAMGILKVGALLISAPFLIIVAIMGAVAVAAYLLYRAWTENWGGMQDKLREVWEKISPIFQGIWGWLTVAWHWSLENLPKAWDWLVKNVWPVLVYIFSGIWYWLTRAWHWSLGNLSKSWDRFIEYVWPVLKVIFSTLWKWLTAAWHWSLENVPKAWDWLAEHVWPILQWIFSGIWYWLTRAWHWSLENLPKAWDWLVVNVWPVLVTIFQSIWDWLGRAWHWSLKNVPKAWDWLVVNVWPWLEFIFTAIWAWLKREWKWKVGGLSKTWDWLTDTVWPVLKEIFQGIWDWLQKTWVWDIKWPEWMAGIGEWFKGLYVEGKEWGGNLSQGIIDGLIEKLESGEALNEVEKAALHLFDPLVYESPGYFPVGAWGEAAGGEFADGVAQGLEEKETEAAEASKGFFDVIVGGLEGLLAKLVEVLKKVPGIGPFIEEIEGIIAVFKTAKEEADKLADEFIEMGKDAAGAGKKIVSAFRTISEDVALTWNYLAKAAKEKEAEMLRDWNTFTQSQLGVSHATFQELTDYWNAFSDEEREALEKLYGFWVENIEKRRLAERAFREQMAILAGDLTALLGIEIEKRIEQYRKEGWTEVEIQTWAKAFRIAEEEKLTAKITEETQKRIATTSSFYDAFTIMVYSATAAHKYATEQMEQATHRQYVTWMAKAEETFGKLSFIRDKYFKENIEYLEERFPAAYRQLVEEMRVYREEGVRTYNIFLEKIMAIQKLWKSASDSIRGNFVSLVEDILLGVKTMEEIWFNFGEAIKRSIIGAFAKILIEKLMMDIQLEMNILQWEGSWEDLAEHIRTSMAAALETISARAKILIPIAKQLAGLFADIWKSSGMASSAASSLRPPSYHTGAFPVKETGLAFVQKGEVITPRSRAGQVGGDVHIGALSLEFPNVRNLAELKSMSPIQWKEILDRGLLPGMKMLAREGKLSKESVMMN